MLIFHAVGMSRHDDFLLKNDDFLLKNDDFIIKTDIPVCPTQEGTTYRHAGQFSMEES